MSSGVAIFVIEVVVLESFDLTEPRLFILAAECFVFDALEPFPLFPFFSVLTLNRVPKRYQTKTKYEIKLSQQRL